MYKYVIAAVLISISCVSCAEKQKTFKESEINAKIDSIVGERMADLSRKAMENLEDRIAIEVKAKSDSILAVRLQSEPVAVPADTAQ